jgi:hypothetical protein
MGEKPHLILPSEFTDASGVVRLTPEVPQIRPREADAVRSIMTPATVVAMTSPPSFADQVLVYATHHELYEFLLEPELAQYLELKPTTTADVLELVRSLPFAPAMRWVASLQKSLAFDRINPDWQRRLMYDVYGAASPISVAGDLFLRSRHDQAAIFSEQQLFALQRLLVLHAASDEAPDLTQDQHIALRLALFYLPGTVLQEELALEAAEAPERVDDERWLRYFVGNGGFAAHGWLKHDMARAHRLYEVIAKSRRARRHQDFCPLEEWLLDEYKLSFVELQALGLVLHAGSQLHVPGQLPVAVTASYYDTTTLAGRLEDGFTALAADRDWFREQFERSTEHPRRAAFETQPFLRRPGLRQADGSIVILAPRAIEGWLSATGAYYRLFDLARAKGSESRKTFTRFNGFLHESYARQLVHIAHPYPQRRTFAVGRVHSAISYRVKKDRRETSDVALDLGIDLVLFEVTAKRLTEKSLVEADAKSVQDDLRMMIIKKMGQLGRVIRDIWDDPSRVPDLDLAHVRRVWPVIVCSDGIFQNPSTWAYTDKAGGHYLQIPRSAVPAEIKPLVLLDIEELEVLMALIGENHSLVTILERKTSPLWRERDLKALLTTEYAHRWSEDPEFVGEEYRRAMKAIVRVIDLSGKRRQRAENTDGTRQAA